MVHLDADEGRACSGAVAAVDPELQDAEHDSDHEASPHAGHGVHGLDWQLAKQRQLEVLQQVVEEDTHSWGLLPGLQGAAAKPVLDWWPHLWSQIQQSQHCWG